MADYPVAADEKCRPDRKQNTIRDLRRNVNGEKLKIKNHTFDFLQFEFENGIEKRLSFIQERPDSPDNNCSKL